MPKWMGHELSRGTRAVASTRRTSWQKGQLWKTGHKSYLINHDGIMGWEGRTQRVCVCALLEIVNRLNLEGEIVELCAGMVW